MWQLLGKAGKRGVIGVPYMWLLVFFALPFLILLRISVIDMGGGVDPFVSLAQMQDGVWTLKLKLANYV